MNRFDRALRELRRETPMEGLENARSAFATKPVSRRIPRLIAFGLAAGVVAVLPFAMQTPALATVGEIQAATEQATRVHSRWYEVKEGAPGAMYLEQWRDGIRSRNDFVKPGARPYVQHAYDGKKSWSRFTEFRYVSVRSFPPPREQTAEGIFSQLFHAVRDQKGKDVPVRRVQVDGKPMLEFTLMNFAYSNAKEVQRYQHVWVVDAERKLPREMRAYNWRGGKWVLVSRGVFDYPEAPLEASTFQLASEDGEVFIDKDAEVKLRSETWPKGLGSQTIGGQTITLRDVILDQRGVLSVIWTGGGRFEKAHEVAVTDKAGRKWTGRPYLAYTRSLLNKIPESRLTKIAGKPNRMVLMYGLHGVVGVPLRVDVPVIASNGKRVGTATFQVRKVQRTDQLADMAEQMGISERSKLPARAIKR